MRPFPELLIVREGQVPELMESYLKTLHDKVEPICPCHISKEACIRERNVREGIREDSEKPVAKKKSKEVKA